MKCKCAILVRLACLVGLGMSNIQAATFTVTHGGPSGPGSLAAVIQEVNASPGEHVIQFGTAQTVFLEAPLPTITRNVTIKGRTDSQTVISGSAFVPILSFSPATTSVVSRLALVDGFSAEGGAAIRNAGTLTVSQSLISGNISGAGKGGAIDNSGDLVLFATDVRGNYARSGGAIWNRGTITIEVSSLAGNSAWEGGAVINEGAMILRGSTFARNAATGGPGWSSPNASPHASGGAILNLGTGVLDSCLVVSNSAKGALGMAVSAGMGFGGAVSVDAGTLRATNTTFYMNSALGGNSDATLGHGAGGAFILKEGSLTLVNCTLTENRAMRGLALPGQPQTPEGGHGQGGGIHVQGGNATLFNTIVAANVAQDVSPDLSGIFVSLGYNLVGNSQAASGLSSKDKVNIPAQLGQLQDNGGATWTCALLAGSPAIDSGSNTGSPLIDQRGVTRPDGKCDMGAFEYWSLMPPALQWLAPADIFYGTPLGSAQLNATADVPGAFTYSPAPGSILPAGEGQTLTALFTPADLTQYSPVSTSVLINVSRAAQTISFAPISEHRIGDPPIFLSAGSSSGLPIQFQIISGPATLVGNQLSFGITPGSISVIAHQPGNQNYEPSVVGQTFFLRLPALPLITTQPVASTGYPGDRLTLEVAAANQPLSYQWQFTEHNLPGATGSTLVLNRVQPEQAGLYRVIVSNPAGSLTSAVVNVSVIVSPATPKITAQPQAQSIRAWENATLSVQASGQAPLAYQWYRGTRGDTNNIILGATSSLYVAPSVPATTQFWVSVRNAHGTVDSTAAQVTVLPVQAAKLNVRTVNGMAAIVIDGTAGVRYTLEYTTDISNPTWHNVAELILPTSPYTFIDPESYGAPTRFYRALAP